MAIRFNCSACKQPIEVDDSDCEKDVMCFYCKAVVKVPGESRLDMAGVGESAIASGQPARKSKMKSVLGLLAGAGSLICFIVILGWLLVAIAPALNEADFDQLDRDQQKELIANKLQEVIRDVPKFAILAFVLAELLAVAGTILSISGMMQKSGVGFAVVGLIISGGIVLFQLFAVFRAVK